MKKISTLVFSIIFSTSLNAQWQQTNGPCGGNISCLATIGNNIFAGTPSGIYLSTNNGSSWTLSNSGMPITAVGAIAISGSNIFAGTEKGVYLSSNNGGLWTPMNNGLTDSTVVAMAISGVNIFAGTADSGVFISTDHGNSWTAANSGLTSTMVRSFAISGSDIYVGTIGGAFLSTNNGSTWTSSNTGLTNSYVLSLAVSGTNVFAGTGGGGVFINSNTTGVNETNKNQIDFNIYPNPFSTTATIDFGGYDSGELVLRIYDGAGKLVRQIKITGSCVIDRMGLKSGIYFWEVVDGEEVVGVRKVVVE